MVAQDRKEVAILRDYVSLQASVLEALESAHGPLDTNAHSQVPRSGTVTTSTGEWTFQRHGGGVSFKRSADGCTIDVHTRPLEPTMFDAWRLRTYLGSLGRRGIKLIDSASGVSGTTLQEKVTSWLERLERQQLIKKAGNTYELSDDGR